MHHLNFSQGFSRAAGEAETWHKISLGNIDPRQQTSVEVRKILQKLDLASNKRDDNAVREP